MQIDPLLEYSSPYTYVGNNPLGYTDPSGMASCGSNYVAFCGNDGEIYGGSLQKWVADNNHSIESNPNSTVHTTARGIRNQTPRNQGVDNATGPIKSDPSSWHFSEVGSVPVQVAAVRDIYFTFEWNNLLTGEGGEMTLYYPLTYFELPTERWTGASISKWTAASMSAEAVDLAFSRIEAKYQSVWRSPIQNDPRIVNEFHQLVQHYLPTGSRISKTLNFPSIKNNILEDVYRRH